MVGRCNRCGGILYSEGVFFDLPAEKPYQNGDQRHQKEDQQRQFEVHHKEIDQKN